MNLRMDVDEASTVAGGVEGGAVDFAHEVVGDRLVVGSGEWWWISEEAHEIGVVVGAWSGKRYTEHSGEEGAAGHFCSRM